MFIPPEAYPPPAYTRPAPRPAVAQVPPVPRDLPPPLALAPPGPTEPRFTPVAIPSPDEVGVRPDEAPVVPIPSPREVGIDVD
jgi:hypothetical protein